MDRAAWRRWAATRAESADGRDPQRVASLPDDTQLVANIMDSTGNQVRRMTLDKTVGIHRTVWNQLR
jgi:hypothetical protein